MFSSLQWCSYRDPAVDQVWGVDEWGALRGRIGPNVYLPEGYKDAQHEGRRWPIIIYLDGTSLGGNHAIWDTGYRSLAHHYGFIFVAPDKVGDSDMKGCISIQNSKVVALAPADDGDEQQPSEARTLWLRGVADGHYADFERRENGHPMLDLHYLSEGAAETALLWWLDERVPAMMPPPDRLLIVTGWGKSRPSVQQSDVRGRVVRVLAAQCVPILETDNPGFVVVDAKGWRTASVNRG